MRIFRVQNDDGKGMYVASDYANKCLTSFDTRHPMPYDDGALMDALDENDESYIGKLFAFSSIEQLKFWLYRTEDREGVTKDGCKVYELEAKEVWVGDTQCVFNKGSETVVQVHCLTEI